MGAGETGVRAILVDGQRIAWVGAEPGLAPDHDRVVDVSDLWATPAFCDAHVHATATGLAADGVDLSACEALPAALERVRHGAATTEGPLVGSGWDETRWPEQRPPTADELAEVAAGRMVRLARIDGHSCVADPATTAVADEATGGVGVDRGPDGRPTGWLREQASEAAWQHVRAHLPASRLESARRRFAADAAGAGIGSIHEMGHPALSSAEDARRWSTDGYGLEVTTWWAVPDAATALDAGLRPGGDLFVDGSIGSATAAVSRGYPDGSRGQLLLEPAAVANLFVDATRAGVGAGVHAIGDRAIAIAADAVDHAASALGAAAVRGCRHRIEHVELPTSASIATMAALGVTASVQPAFDAAWGGAGGLYAQRFGAATALASNPWDDMADAGVWLALGSDAPITPLDPWGGVSAAMRHRGGHSLSLVRALHAHTVGGHRAAGVDDAGRLAPGQRADLALWDRMPSPPEGRPPGCVATIVRGAVIHGPAELLPA